MTRNRSQLFFDCEAKQRHNLTSIDSSQRKDRNQPITCIQVKSSRYFLMLGDENERKN
jgi:hypothetical protein